LAGLAATASAQEYMEAVPQFRPPDQIAIIYPDGTQGPWIDYVPGSGIATQNFAAIWDAYEADPSAYNLDDNVPCEHYDRPPGSGNFCVGQCSGNRFFWCHRQNGCPNPQPSAKNANGGLMVPNHAPEAVNVNFMWGIGATQPNLSVEILVFDEYNGTNCNNPGSTQSSGIAVRFEDPAQGFFYTSVNLVDNGIIMDMPDGDRIGYQVNFYDDEERQVPSHAAHIGIWATKNPEYNAEMGVQDTRGYSDGHFDNDGILENGECVAGTGACPVSGTIRLVGPGLLLLGEGEGDTCIYKAKKAAKAKNCDSCPQKNDRFSSGVECAAPNNCTAKVKGLTIDCPGGGDGSCSKLKGKRVDCGTP
jgi:hypothetical protein